MKSSFLLLLALLLLFVCFCWNNNDNNNNNIMGKKDGGNVSCGLGCSDDDDGDEFCITHNDDNDDDGCFRCISSVCSPFVECNLPCNRSAQCDFDTCPVCWPRIDRDGEPLDSNNNKKK